MFGYVDFNEILFDYSLTQLKNQHPGPLIYIRRVVTQTGLTSSMKNPHLHPIVP